MVTLNKIIVINRLHDNALSGLAISGEGHAPRPRQQPPPPPPPPRPQGFLRGNFITAQKCENDKIYKNFAIF
jgi:hypothetical protein